VGERRISERSRQQIVNATARDIWRLCTVDHFLEQFLLLGRVYELARGEEVLGFDDSPW
jgi:hypothetical protein